MDNARYRRDLYSAAEEICEKVPDNILFYYSGNTMTYRETLELVIKRAAFLSKKGFRKNDIIGLLSASSPEWCITLLAITAIGAIALPMDTSFQGKQYESMVRSAGVKGVFISDEFRGKIRSVPCMKINRESCLEKEKFFKYRKISPDDTAVMLFTSGTTGTPKIVRLSHKNILHVA